ncbi:MAG TPA: EAL domain-containing protein [Solirubrobacterales bacterium]|nr:EAL domain-containing protein [Solirubrobacterales bacterium]
MGQIRQLRYSTRRLLPWAALGFSVLWGAVLGVALAGDDYELAAFGVVGVSLTVVLTVLLYRQQTALQSLAETDSLTGLTNHRGFHQALRTKLREAEARRDSVALVVLDLDDFKTINERHGHPFGDGILQGVGAKLRQSVRGDDIAARTGGEEFALILPGGDADVAQELAEQVRIAIGQLAPAGSELTCSAGVAVFPVDADGARSLLQLAEGALYWAKRSGKSRTRRFDPDHVRLSGDAPQRSEIERILRQRAVEPVFQPVASLTTGRLLGYEALARFPDSPERPPSTWFAQANACGLGPQLEAAAIEAALAVSGRPPGTYLAVNVSPSALSTDVVRSVLPGDLSDLVIELTEHEVYIGDSLLADSLADLRERGARIAIDDAGAGYAGLKQVMWVRPDIVKLDLDLTRAIHSDPVRMALVESLVRFARRVGATVCAEGIEEHDDIEVLANLDVPWGQGYALGRPAPPWSRISPHAAETCRSALAEALISSPGGDSPAISAGDRRLEHLAGRLANTRTSSDLYSTLELMAGELNADKIALSRWHPDRHQLQTLAESGDQVQDEFFSVAEFPATARVLEEQEATQVIVGDPDADGAEVRFLLSQGYSSLLMVPIVLGGESLGIVEAMSEEHRSWARTEINRARIIANQLAAVIPSHFRVGEPERIRS